MFVFESVLTANLNVIVFYYSICLLISFSCMFYLTVHLTIAASYRPHSDGNALRE